MNPEPPRKGDRMSVWGVDYIVEGALASNSMVEPGVIHLHLVLRAEHLSPPEPQEAPDGN